MANLIVLIIFAFSALMSNIWSKISSDRTGRILLDLSKVIKEQNTLLLNQKHMASDLKDRGVREEKALTEIAHATLTSENQLDRMVSMLKTNTEKIEQGFKACPRST